MRIPNDSDLRRWLAREVLEKSVPRKPLGKERRGPARDPEYRAWIRAFPCCACQSRYQVECAHVGADGGMSQKGSDYRSVPLCSNCHTQAAHAYHRIGRKAMERRLGLDLRRTAEELYSIWREGAA